MYGLEDHGRCLLCLRLKAVIWVEQMRCGNQGQPDTFQGFLSWDARPADLIASGDLGMAFAGSANAALMTKDTLAEVVRTMQGIPGYHDIGMDGISDVVFRGFKVITQSIGTAIGPVASTCVVFAGYCASQRRLRVFRMEV
jgi:hypothetical protein